MMTAAIRRRIQIGGYQARRRAPGELLGLRLLSAAEEMVRWSLTSKPSPDPVGDDVERAADPAFEAASTDVAADAVSDSGLPGFVFSTSS